MDLLKYIKKKKSMLYSDDDDDSKPQSRFQTSLSDMIMSS